MFDVSVTEHRDGTETYWVTVGDVYGEPLEVISGSTREETLERLKTFVAEFHVAAIKACVELERVQPEVREFEWHREPRTYVGHKTTKIDPPLHCEPGDYLAFSDDGTKLGRFHSGHLIEERTL